MIPIEGLAGVILAIQKTYGDEEDEEDGEDKEDEDEDDKIFMIDFKW